MDDRIIQFLNEQTCATICCTDNDGNPYCFNCFYVFDQQHGLLYFKSSADAYHDKLLKRNPVIAGTVLPNTLNSALTKGIQLQGEVLAPDQPLAKSASLYYHKKYPMAIAIKGEVFAIMLVSIKMKDSCLGIGKKVVWKMSESN